MDTLRRYIVAWAGLLGVYLAVGAGMELSLHVFHGGWLRLLTVAAGVPTALVLGYALSQWLHAR